MSDHSPDTPNDSSLTTRRGFRNAPVFTALMQHLSATAQGDTLEPFQLEPDAMPDSVLELQEHFDLSLFECAVLLLCYLPSRHALAGSLLSKINQDARLRFPTPSAALDVLSHHPDHDEAAFETDAPLFHFGLVRLEGDTSGTPMLFLTTRTQRYLRDEDARDIGQLPLSKLEPVLRRAFLEPTATVLTKAQTALFEQLVVLDKDAGILALRGGDAESRRAVLSKACLQNLHVIPIFEDTFTPNLSSLQIRSKQTSPLEEWAAVINREAKLLHTAFVLEVHTTNPAVLGQVADLIGLCGANLWLSSREALNLPGIKMQHFELPAATFEDQPELWLQALSHETQSAGVDWSSKALQHRVLHRVLNFMTFNASMIARAAQQALSGFKQHYGSYTDLEDNWAQQEHLEQRIWEAAKAQLRLWLEASPLVQRIETKQLEQYGQQFAQTEGLVLPQGIQDKVDKIISQVKETRRMRQKGLWRGRRGRSMTVLFSGLSGTGKTTTAEVIARELDLDLYRVNLAQTQSKYIGETSKHIEQILDLAQFGGVVLLFDEADALFGKRTVVQDSHDRYANSDVNVLLQGIEYFQGVAILTTNLETSIDAAFKRRFSMVVPFDMPSPTEREGIWQEAIPSYTDPRGGVITDLDFQLLSQLELTGASVRKVIVQAGFNALERGGEEAPITMLDVFEAAQLEIENEGLTWQWTWVEGWPLPPDILEQRPEANTRGRLQFEVMRALEKMFTDAGIKKVRSELLTRDWRASQAETVVNLLLFHRSKDTAKSLHLQQAQAKGAVHDYAFLAFIAARKDSERHFLSGVITSVISSHTQVRTDEIPSANGAFIEFKEGDPSLLQHLASTTNFLDVPVEAPHIFVVSIPTVIPKANAVRKYEKPQSSA